MPKTEERSGWMLIGYAMTIISVGILFYIMLMHNALAQATDAKQGSELGALLAGVTKVCGDSNHPETKVTVTVGAGNKIEYKKDINDFDYVGSTRKDAVERSGCGKNCLCAFRKNEVIQCESMYNMKSPDCQNMGIMIPGKVYDIDLELPTTAWPSRMEDFNCLYDLKLNWDEKNKRVAVKIEKIQPLAPTTAAANWWYRLSSDDPDWAPWKC